MTGYVFYPRYAFLSDITRAQYAVATFTDDHDFKDGEIVSFRVSNASGMFQINNKEAKVLSHDNTSITVNIDSTSFNAFISGLNVHAPPMVVPSASGIIPGSNPATINLKDCFDNLPT